MTEVIWFLLGMSAGGVLAFIFFCLFAINKQIEGE